MEYIATQLAEAVCAGKMITEAEATVLATEPLPVLRAGADAIRRHFCGSTASLCTIINAKSGKCTENCRYCAQSSHYHTPSETYPLLDTEHVLARAKYNESQGAHRFSLVTSGRSLDEADFPALLNLIRQLRAETSLAICASLGLLTPERAVALYDAGVAFYHHNLEACEAFFPSTCTTHTWQMRADTVRHAAAAGMSVCSGGIFGLGETRAHRLQMAFELRALGVASVPLNLLNPIPGTPLADTPPLTFEEVLCCMAVYRYILPRCEIRFAGGRDMISGHFEEALTGGVNAALTGDFLTTTGSTIQSDIALFKRLGYCVDRP